VELREEEKWLPLLAVGERAEANRQSLPEEERAKWDWRQMAWDACTDLSLYGGAPDGTGREDTVNQIMDGWE
jgi:hypothetical protein